MSSDKPSVEIGYWPIRGLLEPLKLLCEFAGQPYTLRLFHSRDEYAEFKSQQPAYCNLPYLKTDSGLFVVQSNAILRHLGRINGLLGAGADEQALQDMVCEQVMDLRNDFIAVVYSSADEFHALAQRFLAEQQPASLARLAAMLGQRAFFGGDAPLYADFHAYEMLKQQTMFKEGALAGHPTLAAYLERFEALPAIASYLASDRFHRLPVNGATSHWGTLDNHDYYRPKRDRE